MWDLNEVFITEAQRQEARVAFSKFTRRYEGNDDVVVWNGPFSGTCPVFHYRCPWTGRNFRLSARRVYHFLETGHNVPPGMKTFVPIQYPATSVSHFEWAGCTTVALRYAYDNEHVYTLKDELAVQ